MPKEEEEEEELTGLLVKYHKRWIHHLIKVVRDMICDIKLLSLNCSYLVSLTLNPFMGIFKMQFTANCLHSWCCFFEVSLPCQMWG